MSAAPPPNDNQKLSAIDTLGIKYRSFSSKVKSLALSKPSDFFNLRHHVQEQLEERLVTVIYEEIYQFLKYGKIDKKDIKIANAAGTGSINLPAAPSVPPQKINSIALAMCSDIGKSLEEAINLVLPDDFNKIVDSGLSMKGRIVEG